MRREKEPAHQRRFYIVGLGRFLLCPHADFLRKGGRSRMFGKLRQELSVFSPVRFLIVLGLLVVSTFSLAFFLPEGVDSLGGLSLLPALFLVLYIFTTKRILEALVLASLMCFILADRADFFSEFSIGLVEVMKDENTGWLIVVCGLMGSIILLIEKAGGSFAFGQFVAGKSKGRRSTLLWTWLLGVVVFIDDYLNSLTVGACMAPITDRYKVSREYLSYVVDSTAAPICVLIPISTWAVFASRILVMNGVTTEDDGILYFIRTIPYNFYAWIAAIIVVLVIMGWFPLIGPLKRAERRVQDGGPLAPPNSDKIDIHSSGEITIPQNPRMINFALPMLVLVVATILFDVDMQKGVLVTLAFMFVFYVAQGIMTPDEFADYCIDGLKNMILPLLLMVLAFLFSYASDRIHFTRQVIDFVVPYMTPQLMPVLIFIVLGATEFITGTNWGLYIIALPIVIPLSQAVGGNTLLAVSAVLSAGVFGSHICFYSDATILSSSACGCNNFDHAYSQMPYGLISAGLASICFLIAGFVFR